MLNELTEAQKAALAPHSAKWTAIGLSTDPIDRSKAMDAVNLAYGQAGLKAPAQFVWCRSPMAMDLAFRLVGGSSIRPSVYNKPWAAISDAVDSKFH